MCGRFTLRAPASVIAEQFSLSDLPSLPPRYNIAPTQTVAVVRQVGEPGGTGRELVNLRWGLIPHWAKDPAIGNRMINARSESVAEKPAYRTALRRRRCLVAADGFYEWQPGGQRKQPYFIHMKDDRPFGFAGLWETWEGPENSYIESCTIITTDANALMAPIHDRMPVIVDPKDYGLWLDASVQNPARLLPLLCPFQGDLLVAEPVGTRVNSPANDDAACIAPLNEG